MSGRAAAVRTIAAAPLTRRAWAEAVYCLIGFPLALSTFIAMVLLLAFGTGLVASLAGAVLGVVLVVAGTGLAWLLAIVHRFLAAHLLGIRVAAPMLAPPGKGRIGRLDAWLRDASVWRSVAYVLVKLPVAVFGLYAFGWWFTGLVNLIAPVRWWLNDPATAPILLPLPSREIPDAGSFAETFAFALLGAGQLLVAPWIVRGVVTVDGWLIRALLGPGALAERVRDLEETRALAVDDSAALLRRVERDLHDGAQVRLVAVAMSLDMAREKLGADGDQITDADRVRELVGSAYRNATEALTELRDLARGIHPPVLDDGLPDALATLAARSPVPVALAMDVRMRPTAAIETIAYFCAAELLTNVIKHSGARQVVLGLSEENGMLRLSVTDDGRGGASPGGGLTGLAQRVRTVDGTLDITSPPGGPTEITVTLPLHA